ncbi:SPOSA6832_00616 [Sporobolomyces salmonicolor]|uniref:SPOSA6832_00616-mRNA-1:cds n=1 Tax=Sporidiobolus salmonicolor TaxID=5005 RepID=A0A0D6EHR4_SPOSA|nr:SPOSA6832_00616 [Sporobolomyces salmonicolor]
MFVPLLSNPPSLIPSRPLRVAHLLIGRSSDRDSSWCSNRSTQPLLQRSRDKRIALPVRVEPKVFFANERTFLSWLNFTVVLGGLAVGLLNFGDRVGKISAGMFTIVSMSIMVYALVTYHWRANAIRKRGSGPYDDRLGPTILCLALFAAVITNFILRFTA